MAELSNRELLNIAEKIAVKAGDILKKSKAEVILSMGKDIKISSDKESHKIIIKGLSKTGIKIISEEDDFHQFGMNYSWVVDPLDGSMNFFKKIPISAVSIGLIRNGKSILGVVYDFNRDEMFTGIVGEGAWLNGERIYVSKIKEKNEAVIATGFPSYTNFSKKSLEEYISLIQDFKKVRLLGSASISLAYLACGRVDAYYEKDIKIWDVAGGMAIVEAGGGQCSNFEFDKKNQGVVLVAATKNLHEDFCASIV